MTEKTKKTISKITNVFLTVFLIFAALVTVFATITATSSDGTPSIGNKMYLIILSNSMQEDTGFAEGSMIVCRKLTADEKKNLEVGEVVTFRHDIDLTKSGDELNTHRIVKIISKNATTTVYKTKGDHNSLEDTYTITNEDIVGVWTGEKTSGEAPLHNYKKGVELRGVGAFMGFLTSKWGFLLLIVLPLAIFFVLEIFNVAHVIRTIRGKRTITAKDEEEIKRKAVEEYLKMQQAETAEQAETQTETAEQAETAEQTETQAEVADDVVAQENAENAQSDDENKQ